MAQTAARPAGMACLAIWWFDYSGKQEGQTWSGWRLSNLQFALEGDVIHTQPHPTSELQIWVREERRKEG